MQSFAGRGLYCSALVELMADTKMARTAVYKITNDPDRLVQLRTVGNMISESFAGTNLHILSYSAIWNLIPKSVLNYTKTSLAALLDVIKVIGGATVHLGSLAGNAGRASNGMYSGVRGVISTSLPR